MTDGAARQPDVEGVEASRREQTRTAMCPKLGSVDRAKEWES